MGNIYYERNSQRQALDKPEEQLNNDQQMLGFEEVNFEQKREPYQENISTAKTQSKKLKRRTKRKP